MRLFKYRPVGVKQLVAALIMMSGGAGAFAAEPAFLNTAQMEVVRQQLHDNTAAPQTSDAYRHLLAAADSALNKPNLSVTDKGMTPPSGSKHDYLSLSAYWWPTTANLMVCRGSARTGTSIRPVKTIKATA